MGKAANLEEYSITRMAAKANKFMPPDRELPNSPLADIAYAYHFDAMKLAKLLACPVWLPCGDTWAAMT